MQRRSGPRALRSPAASPERPRVRSQAVARAAALALAVSLAFHAPAPQAQSVELWVQPGLGPVSEPGGAARLATYLADAGGVPVRERTSRNVLAHWRATGELDGAVLILDEAHFVDARARDGAHVPFARIAGLVGHSVVSAPGILLLDVDELEGRTIAAPPAPALATLRVIALFPDPLRRPRLRDARDLDAIVALLRAGRVDAAVVPSEALGDLPELNAVLDAELAPGPGLTASAAIPSPVREAMRDALLGAASRPRGRALLEALGVDGFETADAETYDGFAVLLRGTWPGDRR